MDDLAYFYDALMDRLELRSAIVMGTSFGGWIAAELAVLAPHRIDRLVLVDAIGLRVKESPIGDLFAMDPPEMMGALFHDPQVAARLFAGKPDVELLVRFHHDEASFARYAWHPFCCNPKLARRLHRITAPTLVLWGEHDRVVPLAHGRRYAELIPNARLEIVPHAAHAVLMERPDAAADAIRRFLQDR